MRDEALPERTAAGARLWSAPRVHHGFSLASANRHDADCIGTGDGATYMAALSPTAEVLSRLFGVEQLWRCSAVKPRVPPHKLARTSVRDKTKKPRFAENIDGHLAATVCVAAKSIALRHQRNVAPPRATLKFE